MNRRAGLAILALSLPLLATQTAHAAPAPCLQHPLTTVSGLTGLGPSGAAPAGRFVVGSGERSDGQQSAVRWHDGVPKQLGITGDFVRPVDASDDGQIVITTSTANLRYRDGVTEQLPTPTGYAGAGVTAIDNAHGLIAGYATDANGENGHGVVWSATNQPRVLTLPTGFNHAIANDIDDDGTVVGIIQDWDWQNANIRAQEAVAWNPDGTITVLPKTDTSPEPTAIRNGTAVGADAGQAVSWNLAAGTPPTPIARGKATALNDRGDVLVGTEVALTAQGLRPLEQKDSGGASGISVAALTNTRQLYGTDGFTHQAVRWDCN
ncbi:hypothetical protein E1263_16615 [Kribbella antibiotica]|uniref:HAF repeat-containing protein n=1 Tax=Kribbella antibiotica TaxID=190195 RepID=A0A4R4ZKE9_9ACTN|nr:hypothetical protein [Kribbella antibiotica]TDD59025.1 hypothetical protein E1263_16615 [Kribbella antibiotica]